MAKDRLEIKKSAAKEIEKLPRRDMTAVLERISALAEHPRPADSKKISGDYRILYLIADDVLIVFIVKVGHRKDVYR